jgi:hypothetical protein
LNSLLHAKPGCSSEFSGIEFGEAQLVQIKVVLMSGCFFAFVLEFVATRNSIMYVLFFLLLFDDSCCYSIGVNFELCYEL